jgi:hypothetical protein
VLFTIGLSFMAGAGATFVWGPSQQPVELPAFLHGQIAVLGIDLGAYRLFLVALVVALTAGLGLFLTRTRFGARLRAAVDNQQAAAGAGINVGLLFSVTFALGSALAGLGGALAIDVLGLDPTFGRQVLRPSDRQLHHLRRHGGAADRFPVGAPWPPPRLATPSPLPPDPPGSGGRAGIRWRSRSGSPPCPPSSSSTIDGSWSARSSSMVCSRCRWT